MDLIDPQNFNEVYLYVRQLSFTPTVQKRKQCTGGTDGGPISTPSYVSFAMTRTAESSLSIRTDSFRATAVGCALPGGLTIYQARGFVVILSTHSPSFTKPSAVSKYVPSILAPCFQV